MQKTDSVILARRSLSGACGTLGVSKSKFCLFNIAVVSLTPRVCCVRRYSEDCFALDEKLKRQAALRKRRDGVRGACHKSKAVRVKKSSRVERFHSWLSEATMSMKA